MNKNSCNFNDILQKDIFLNNVNRPTMLNICAVIITYHPDKDLPERIEKIISQVAKVVIVDNNSPDKSLNMLNKLSSQKKIDLIVNNDNLGIATALNQGLYYAIKCGYTWVLTLDQDTIPFPTMIQHLIKAYFDCPYRDLVGIIGSNSNELNTSKIFMCDIKGHTSWKEVKEVITSGSLMSLHIFNIIGSFKEDLFIDLVDFEYCLRLRSNGYKNIITNNVIMSQSYGSLSINKYIFFKKIVRDYSPLRNYYRTRNGLYLIRNYFFKETMWSIKRLIIIIIRPLSVLLFEKNKLQKIKYILLGIQHAFQMKLGKLIIS
jgi:rhamnosyltransferase